MGSIDWAKLPSQPEFDRVVEAFFVNENADLPKEAYAVNGRGGDGGIDIHIRRDGKLIIVQLKFFPEGFSGGWAKTRRDQIRDSFKSALTHDPDEWWLVVPTTLTSEERDYVVGLPGRQTPKLTKPDILVLDRPRLDALAAKHPDLVTYFDRDTLLEAAKVYNHEKSLMVDTDDLADRLRALTKQAESLDPDWRHDVFTSGDIVGMTVVAKNPHAAERSPITLKMTASFAPEQKELQEQFERAVHWGTPERVDLPASVVGNVSVDGPPAFAREGTPAEVSLIPTVTDDATRPCTLVFYSNDQRVATFPGTTTWLGGASVGSSVRAEFYGAIKLEFLLPHDRTQAASLSVTSSFRGREPTQVLRSMALIERLQSEDSVALEIDGEEVARLLPSPSREELIERMGDYAKGMDPFKEYVEDLEAVQRMTSQFFPLPETVTGDDRLFLRCIRLLLEGNCIVMPGYRELNQTLSGENIEPLREILGGEPQTALVEMPNLQLEIFGHTFDLGHARLYAPQVEIVDPGAILGHLESGDIAGKPFKMRASDGYGIWVLLPPLFQSTDDVVRPVSLGLEGIDDAPDIARALEMSGQQTEGVANDRSDENDKVS